MSHTFAPNSDEAQTIWKEMSPDSVLFTQQVSTDTLSTGEDRYLKGKFHLEFYLRGVQLDLYQPCGLNTLTGLIKCTENQTDTYIKFTPVNNTKTAIQTKIRFQLIFKQEHLLKTNN